MESKLVTVWRITIPGRNARRTQSWDRSQDHKNNGSGFDQGHGVRSEFKDLQGGYKPDDDRVDSITNILDITTSGPIYMMLDILQ